MRVFKNVVSMAVLVFFSVSTILWNVPHNAYAQQPACLSAQLSSQASHSLKEAVAESHVIPTYTVEVVDERTLDEREQSSLQAGTAWRPGDPEDASQGVSKEGTLTFPSIALLIGGMLEMVSLYFGGGAVSSNVQHASFFSMFVYLLPFVAFFCVRMAVREFTAKYKDSESEAQKQGRRKAFIATGVFVLSLVLGGIGKMVLAVITFVVAFSVLKKSLKQKENETRKGRLARAGLIAMGIGWVLYALIAISSPNSGRKAGGQTFHDIAQTDSTLASTFIDSLGKFEREPIFYATSANYCAGHVSNFFNIACQNPFAAYIVGNRGSADTRDAERSLLENPANTVIETYDDLNSGEVAICFDYTHTFLVVRMSNSETRILHVVGDNLHDSDGITGWGLEATTTIIKIGEIPEPVDLQIKRYTVETGKTVKGLAADCGFAGSDDVVGAEQLAYFQRELHQLNPGLELVTDHTGAAGVLLKAGTKIKVPILSAADNPFLNAEWGVTDWGAPVLRRFGRKDERTVTGIMSELNRRLLLSDREITVQGSDGSAVGVSVRVDRVLEDLIVEKTGRTFESIVREAISRENESNRDAIIAKLQELSRMRTPMVFSMVNSAPSFFGNMVSDRFVAIRRDVFEVFDVVDLVSMIGVGVVHELRHEALIAEELVLRKLNLWEEYWDVNDVEHVSEIQKRAAIGSIHAAVEQELYGMDEALWNKSMSGEVGGFFDVIQDAVLRTKGKAPSIIELRLLYFAAA